ncbi:aspartate aminotransferase family protein [Aquimarina addita]|uniref:Aspartate aminotransferase family protein n=1 Tax=Aquimarina addita TaxID=870485 RepID=A0ABP6UP06_9FLAO
MSLQKRIYREIQDKTIFTNAQQYAFEYMDTVFDRNIYPTKKALQSLSNFEEQLPADSTEAKAVLTFLNTYGAPATLPTTGGRYFGFVSGGALPIGIAAKSLATFWDQAPAMHVLSPIGSQLEAVVENWLQELFCLPTSTVAGFVSGTSTANLCGLSAARFRILEKLDWNVNKKGLFNAPKIRIVTGRHAHATILKAIGILGFGIENIEWVDVDDQGRIIADSIPILDDKTILILQAGNVNSGAFDDFENICAKAREANAWVHIDGAFGLWAGAVAKLKHLTKGMEQASSWAVDGHKTLNTPYDCGIVLCTDKEALKSSLHMSGSYIVESKERDGMFYTPEMSRRARIIELWAVMKYLGREGIDEMIYTMHLRAQQFSSEIQRIKGFKVLNEVVFNQVIVQCESDKTTTEVLSKIQELRECWVGGSTWFEKKIIRVSVCSWATTEDDITRSTISFKKALAQVKLSFKNNKN